MDDEETVRNITRQMLEQCGYRVLTAGDGQEGAQALRDHSEEISAVLLDLTMPHMDGETAFMEIRRVKPEARVILMSGYTEQDATNRFAGKELAGFIQKPFRLQQLLGKVAEVLE